MLTAHALLSDGTRAAVSVADPVCLPVVAGGYYIGGNATPAADMTGVNWTSQTGYRSLAETSLLPAGGWHRQFIAAGCWLNLVVEFKHYGTSSVGAQTFTVEGRSYTVPAPAGRIQKGTAPGALAYGYDQMVSGQLDGLLHRAVAGIRTALTTSGRLNLQICSEMDTDHQFGTTEGPDSYYWAGSDVRGVAAVTYLINWMRRPPAGIAPLPARVTFSLGWAGQWSGVAPFVRCHPDNLPVDYMAWNSYNHSANWTPDARLKETAAYRASCGPRMRALPVIIAEWGTNAAHPGGQAAYIRAWPDAVNRANAHFAGIGHGPYVCTNYFGSRDPAWGALSPKADGLAALKDAYAASPYIRLPRGAA